MSSVYPPTVPWTVSYGVTLPAGASVGVVTAYAYTRGPGLVDPVPAALTTVRTQLALVRGLLPQGSDACVFAYVEGWCGVVCVIV